MSQLLALSVYLAVIGEIRESTRAEYCSLFPNQIHLVLCKLRQALPLYSSWQAIVWEHNLFPTNHTENMLLCVTYCLHMSCNLLF